MGFLFVEFLPDFSAGFPEGRVIVIPDPGLRVFQGAIKVTDQRHSVLKDLLGHGKIDWRVSRGWIGKVQVRDDAQFGVNIA